MIRLPLGSDGQEVRPREVSGNQVGEGSGSDRFWDGCWVGGEPVETRLQAELETVNELGVDGGLGAVGGGC